MTLKKWNRRDAIKAMAAAPALLMAGRGVAAEGDVSRLVMEKDRLKILAVTDLHFFNRGKINDIRTMRIIRKMVEHFSPDLLVADGDVWHENPRHKGLSYCAYACEQLSSLGVPWAYVRGNHDNADDFKECEKLLSTAPNSLYPGTGLNADYRVDVTDSAGEVKWRLLAVNDSNPVKGFKAATVEKVENEVARIKSSKNPDAPCFIFCHIPPPDYLELVKEGKAVGVMHEKCCHEAGASGVAEKLSKSGIIKAMFCGHDHVNNYYGEMSGVRLEYVRSTGYGGYGGWRVKKGGTLIDVNLARGEYETMAVFADGSTWEISGTPKLMEK